MALRDLLQSKAVQNIRQKAQDIVRPIQKGLQQAELARISYQRERESGQTRDRVVKTPFVGDAYRYVEGRIGQPISRGVLDIQKNRRPTLSGGLDIAMGAANLMGAGLLENAVSSYAQSKRTQVPYKSPRSFLTNFRENLGDPYVGVGTTGLGLSGLKGTGVDLVAGLALGSPKSAIKSGGKIIGKGGLMKAVGKQFKFKPKSLLKREDISILNTVGDRLKTGVDLKPEDYNFLKNAIKTVTNDFSDAFDKKLERLSPRQLYNEVSRHANLSDTFFERMGDRFNVPNLLSKARQELTRPRSIKDLAGTNIPKSGTVTDPKDFGLGFVSGDKTIKQRQRQVVGQLSLPNIQKRAYNAQADPKTLSRIMSREHKQLERSIKKSFKEFVRKNTLTESQAVGVIEKSIRQATKSPASQKVENLKDISGFTGGFRDVFRNFKAVYGKRFPEIKKAILDPFSRSKGDFIETQKALIKQLNDNVVKRFNIKKGSEKSRIIQLWGEGEMDLVDLKSKRPNDWEEIVEADKFFRKTYDELLDRVNSIRSSIYPNQKDKIIPKRKNYYRHFREMREGFGGLLNIFDEPSGIPSKLAGVSDFTKPKAKWLSFAQQRLGNKTEIDAVGGFIDYIKAASYAIHIDPHTAAFRNLASELAEATSEGVNQGKLNNFIEFLNDFSNDLSGKTNPLDRAFQKWVPGTRKTMMVINWLNSRVKANVILGNVSSSLAQIANIPQGLASAGVHSAAGVGDTLSEIFTRISGKKHVISKSNFIKERYGSGIYDEFDKGMINNTRKFAAWMTGALDVVGTRLIWNSHYRKAIAQGIENPIQYADDITRNLVAGRGIGEVPLAQKSKLFQLVAPFQLEVGNLWWIMKDMVDERRFGQLATLFVANHVLNKTIESIRGSGVVFDPIESMVEGFDRFEEEGGGKRGALLAGGRIAGEVLSNVPFGQTVASAYPEYGIEIGGKTSPTREDLFGKGDPTRFGSGLLLTKGLSDPLFKVIPPYGGSQIRKTLEGNKAYEQGYTTTKSGKIRPFVIEETPINKLRTLLFGQYSTPEARKYFDEDQKPLGDKQSEVLKSIGNREERKEYLDSIILKRFIDRVTKKIKEGKEVTDDENSLLVSSVSAAEFTPGSTPLIREAQRQVLKAKLDLGNELNNKELDLLYEKDLNKITSMDSVSALEIAKKKNDAFKMANKFLRNEDITDENKKYLIEKIDVNLEDLEYYNESGNKIDIKTEGVLDQINGVKDRKEILNILVNGRREVNGRMLVSNGVIDELFNRGVISEEEKKLIKDMEYQDGKPEVKVSGRGKGAKLKRIRLKKVQIPTIKRVKQKAPQSKKILTRGSVRGLSGLKRTKQNQPIRVRPIEKKRVIKDIKVRPISL